MRKTPNKRGVGIIEVVLAFMIIAVALVALYGTFMNSYKLSVMTRNQIAAHFLATSFFEEVEGHNYGDPAPAAWPVPTVGDPPATPPPPPSNWEGAGWPGTQSLPVYVEGRIQASNYHRQLSLRNGSLVGKSTDNWDEVCLIITWKEGGSETNPTGLKTLTAKRLVWRENAPK